MQGYSAEEAAIIFNAAAKHADPVLRWVPALCALSGARVVEVCQLHREDVRLEHGIWCMDINANTGSLKTASSVRLVPIHSYLRENGFLEYASGKGTGPLFYSASRINRSKSKSPASVTAEKVARFIRGLGIKVGRKEHRKDPNHAWRHYFKTLLRDDDAVKKDVSDRLTGHSAADTGSGYGTVSLATLARAIERVPVPKRNTELAASTTGLGAA